MKLFFLSLLLTTSRTTLLLGVVGQETPTVAPTASQTPNPGCDWELRYYGTAESTGTACDGINDVRDTIRADGTCQFHPAVGYYEALCSDIGGSLVFALAHCQEGCIDCQPFVEDADEAGITVPDDSFVTRGEAYIPGICYFLFNEDNLFRPIAHAWSVSGSCDLDSCEINSRAPTFFPTQSPSVAPSNLPSSPPSQPPTNIPSSSPSHPPSNIPSSSPSDYPTTVPSTPPTNLPSSLPSVSPSYYPSTSPSNVPSGLPSALPSNAPSSLPSQRPSTTPSTKPSAAPSTSALPTTTTMAPSVLPSGPSLLLSAPPATSAPSTLMETSGAVSTNYNGSSSKWSVTFIVTAVATLIGTASQW